MRYLIWISYDTKVENLIQVLRSKWLAIWLFKYYLIFQWYHPLGKSPKFSSFVFLIPRLLRILGLRYWIADLSMKENHLEGLLKTDCWVSLSFWFSMSGWGSRIYISREFLSVTAAAVPRTMLWKSLVKNKQKLDSLIEC